MSSLATWCRGRHTLQNARRRGAGWLESTRDWLRRSRDHSWLTTGCFPMHTECWKQNGHLPKRIVFADRSFHVLAWTSDRLHVSEKKSARKYDTSGSGTWRHAMMAHDIHEWWPKQDTDSSFHLPVISLSVTRLLFHGHDTLLNFQTTWLK